MDLTTIIRITVVTTTTTNASVNSNNNTAPANYPPLITAT
eukprot:CAMPEP_0119525988 /NCGR_PEP_ID=MMETSP1344-20130328/40668_1 /TAXON_ID=236787 /ORGANISM="Florenciella parvula, Strain CCMP2471" /LENGTH=39 /DNA_ID= /DNA_START= /DNA_END= /DNA_ORIENTATION=